MGASSAAMQYLSHLLKMTPQGDMSIQVLYYIAGVCMQCWVVGIPGHLAEGYMVIGGRGPARYTLQVQVLQSVSGSR